MKKNYIQPKMVSVNVYQESIMTVTSSIQGKATSNDFMICAPQKSEGEDEDLFLDRDTKLRNWNWK